MAGSHIRLIKYIEQQYKPVSWIIEGDISNCFDSIDSMHALYINRE